VQSPVDGFVGKRTVDPGAMVNTNTAILSVVDISSLRLVANVVEKDLRMVTAGDMAEVEVDAYPGEKFKGRIARVAPVLDPATRTAAMEVEIPNSDSKLKPGMYARINLTIEEHESALVIPKTAVVDYSSQRGVWVPNDQDRATFVPLKLGIENSEQIEVLGGLSEGARFVNNGAGAVRNNDQLLYAGQDGPSGGQAGRGGRGGQGRGNAASKLPGARPGGQSDQPPRKGPGGE
jgi:RND family efflux transporter MFP subunit